MKTIWVAEFRYGTPRMAKVAVEKETDKTFTVSKSDDVLAWVYVGKRVNKTDANWFESSVAALEWLIERQSKHIEDMRASIEKSQTQLTQLQEVLGMAKAKQEGRENAKTNA